MLVPLAYSELTSRVVKGAGMQWNIQLLSKGCDVSDVYVGCLLAT